MLKEKKTEDTLYITKTDRKKQMVTLLKVKKRDFGIHGGKMVIKELKEHIQQEKKKVNGMHGMKMA